MICVLHGAISTWKSRVEVIALVVGIDCTDAIADLKSTKLSSNCYHKNAESISYLHDVFYQHQNLNSKYFCMYYHVESIKDFSK